MGGRLLAVPACALGNGLCHASCHLLRHRDRTSARRIARDRTEGRDPSAAQVAAAHAGRCGEPAALDPVFDPDDFSDPAHAVDRRYIGRHHGLHCPAGDRGVPVHRAACGKQPARGGPECHRNGAKPRRLALGNRLQGDAAGEPAVPDRQRNHCGHHRPRLFRDERYHRRRRSRQDRHQLRILPLSVSYHAFGCAAAHFACAASAGLRHRACSPRR